MEPTGLFSPPLPLQKHCLYITLRPCRTVTGCACHPTANIWLVAGDYYIALCSVKAKRKPSILSSHDRMPTTVAAILPRQRSTRPLPSRAPSLLISTVLLR